MTAGCSGQDQVSTSNDEQGQKSKTIKVNNQQGDISVSRSDSQVNTNSERHESVSTNTGAKPKVNLSIETSLPSKTATVTTPPTPHNQLVNNSLNPVKLPMKAIKSTDITTHMAAVVHTPKNAPVGSRGITNPEYGANKTKPVKRPRNKSSPDNDNDAKKHREFDDEESVSSRSDSDDNISAGDASKIPALIDLSDHEMMSDAEEIPCGQYKPGDDSQKSIDENELIFNQWDFLDQTDGPKSWPLGPAQI